MMHRQGTYALIARLDRRSQVRVGALGEASLPQGYYCYVGSALAHLDKRLARHMASDKRLRWHIDYLLQKARVIWLVVIPGERRLECEFSQMVAALAHPPLVPGFGSSDCACKTHLHYFPQSPAQEVLALAQELGPALLKRASSLRA